ncbi:MAG TPA: polyprenyl diphosphate synthase [Rectinema sp.]|jgi:undecaprenyl diphosphate synthase|nr:polyprenyl diphosphate synthase [Spirochaetota bacterium]OQC75092.1 MAG: Isoprenyl transferase [Spirochaetes bacterium ADurb.Bin001]HNP92243.1 polyprenyl diphosphate synthase [Rectinema sp.]HNT58619.1 polyprenyl diphosphate synthase [Rectinema sp.]HNV35398.1 polyprenyl diphosphate synthase [Rectinema sp.]
MKENRMPSHVAIIMDGNGRWARQRGLARTEGHKEGLKTAKRIVLASRKEKIEFLSLFVFSTENWKRTEQEVGFLMSLIRAHITKELNFYRKNEIRIVHSGERNGLPHDVLSEIDKAIENTSQYSSLTVNLAINYGGRDEIVRAMQRILASQENDDENPIDELKIMRYLDHPEIPDPDLIIRTGGEIRLSNFLLWQSAYSELYFSPKYWPDFTPEDLHAALIDYVHRERRFGDAR